MFEHAIGFNLVERRLKKTLLLQFIVVIVSNGSEFLCLLIEELKIGSTLILDIFRFFGFSGPFILVAPLFLVFLVFVVRVFEIIFFLGFFPV